MFSLFFQEGDSSGRYDSSSNHKAMAKASCSDLRHLPVLYSLLAEER